MALEAPLRSSIGHLHFPFSTQADMTASPEPDGLWSPLRTVYSSSPPAATDSASLRPTSAHRLSNPALALSPSDIVGPSPVTSNGTEIDEDASEEVHQAHMTDVDASRRSGLLVLAIDLPDTVRQPSSEEAVSVIHAPEGFVNWTSTELTTQNSLPIEHTSPEDDRDSSAALDSSPQKSPSPQARPPISTDVKPVRYSVESATPQAQDLQSMLKESSRLRSSSSSSLEKIDEQTEAEGDGDIDVDHAGLPPAKQVDEVAGLRTALQECWKLCNTLANMSSNHRARVFSHSGTPDAHEKAWKTCWKLCQRLYSKDEESGSLNVRMNLELCRDLFQVLFDVRQRKDEAADSVLRVSFELNNQSISVLPQSQQRLTLDVSSLYRAQDRPTLPEAFKERTLDFYITLCHRLMKQRSEYAEETDQLLKACWGLAEMLFSLRQSRRDGHAPDEELLGSAVQACWELCDIFRDGWTQLRPDRNTPRLSQTSIFPQQPTDVTGRESRQSNRSSLHSKRESVKSGSSRQDERPRKRPPVPETSVTEFEDTPVSPESRSPQMPNIMVLGTSDGGRGGRWSSNASNMSSYSRSSNRTSSTATTTTATEDPNVVYSKVLVVRAAMNLGFDRDAVTDPKAGAAVLYKFVQGLPTGSFGSLPSHATLLQQYKNAVLKDSFLPRSQALPVRGKRVSAQDIARSVQTISNSSPRHAYLRELFKFVFQFSIDEVESRRNVTISV